MHVILIMAITLDGKIGKDSNHPVDWSGKKDKTIFVRTTKKAGVVIMGSKTFDTLNMILPGRKNIVMTRDKNRKSDDNNLLFTDKDPEEILTMLEGEGYKEAALIGGSIINALVAEKNLIDEIQLTVVPRLFGKGLSLFNRELNARLELQEMELIEKDYIFLKYLVKK